MAIFSVQGLYGRQKVRENYISLKLDKRLGVLCQVIEFRRSLCNRSVKSLSRGCLKLFLFLCFCMNKELWFKKLAEPSFCWFMVRIIILHGLWKLLYSQWKVKDFFFVLGCVNPVSSLDSILLCLGQILSGNLMEVFNSCLMTFFRVYNVEKHPKYQNGEMTEEQIFRKFLNTFEVGSAEVDGKVRFHFSCRAIIKGRNP